MENKKPMQGSMNNGQHERECKEFEEWVGSQGCSNLTKHNQGYAEPHIDSAWIGWQAARANSGWLPIESAPKDGTEIILYHPDWDCSPIASWDEYPGNPVEGEGEEVWMHGWIMKDEFTNYGGHEDGFLGWEDDPKPTLWQNLPTQPQSNQPKERI